MRIIDSNKFYHLKNNVPLEKVSHLAIGAHPDDLEIFAYHAILQCYKSEQNHFCGVVLCDGAGSPRGGRFANIKDAEMAQIRKSEQIKAAKKGNYHSLFYLEHKSADIKKTKYQALEEQLLEILQISKPKYIYCHSIFDNHETHTASASYVVNAVRALAKKDADFKEQLKLFVGCEVWGSLDWLPNKVELEVSKYPELAFELCDIFQSQIDGGKNYSEGVMARRRANAVFNESHKTDKESHLTFAIDYLPLLDGLSVKDFAKQHLDSFSEDKTKRIYDN